MARLTEKQMERIASALAEPRRFKILKDRRDAARTHGTADDIALVAVFLASDDARWVAGESLRVAGGLT